jgi:hypothetical protein
MSPYTSNASDSHTVLHTLCTKVDDQQFIVHLITLHCSFCRVVDLSKRDLAIYRVTHRHCPLLEIDLDKSICHVEPKSSYESSIIWATFEILASVVGPRMTRILNDLRKNFSSNLKSKQAFTF